MNESLHKISKRGVGFKDITGQRFGKLVALNYSHTINKKAYWRLLCDCGKETITIGSYVRCGDTTSCGCVYASTKSKFGLVAKSFRGYGTWRCMINRCHDPSDKDYSNYGARGIYVCEKWRKSFVNFLSDMGPRPDGKTLHRIDNDLGYFKENCMWATNKIQNRTKRSNVFVEINGVTKCVVDWIEHFGLKKGCYVWRVTHGWSRERALSTPSKGVAD